MGVPASIGCKKCLALVRWLIACSFVVKIQAFQTQTWLVLSTCDMSWFCCMASTVIHDVHDRHFETPWL